jgi:hypothetical protein
VLTFLTAPLLRFFTKVITIVKNVETEQCGIGTNLRGIRSGPELA